MQVYEGVVGKLDELGLEEMRGQVTAYHTKLVTDYLDGKDISSKPGGERVVEICKHIQKQAPEEFGKYKEGFTAKDAMIQRSTDLVYAEQANKVIQGLVQSEISKNRELSLLDIPSSGSRNTYMVAGGQASGKGSSVERIKASAIEEGISWKNIVKINTDSYKSLLLEPGTVKPELYSQLAQEEATVIHQKIQGRLVQMAKEGKAPHVFVDQVFVGRDKVEMGLINGGKVRGMIVSTEVGDAVERSYARGLSDGKTGRYENTQGILRCHKLMSEQIPAMMASFLGQDIQFLLVDNNVPKGEQANNVMGINLKSGEIEIYSQANLERFIQKGQINVDAHDRASLYKTDGVSTGCEVYLGPLIKDEKCKIIKQDIVSSAPNAYEQQYVTDHGKPEDDREGIVLNV